MRRAAVSLLLLAWCAAAGTLGERIEQILAESPAAGRAVWGIRVVDAATGALLLDRNGDRFFVPASNAKVLTVALALDRLGPDHRFRTRVAADAEPDPQGTVRGDLRLIGGGDPTLSGRPVPYQRGARNGDPLQPIEEMADTLVARGLKRIAGGIVGDDTAYVWAPHPEGWAESDGTWEYGAPVSSLAVNDNAVTLTVRPGRRTGEAASVQLRPAIDYFTVDNRVRTVTQGETRVEVERAPGSRQLRLWGTVSIRNGASIKLLAVDDPALFAARALHEALVRRGIAIHAPPTARHRYANEVPDLRRGSTAADPQPAGVVLAERVSPPLVETLTVVNKLSQNLHAEMALREVGRIRRGIGSREAGLEELKAFLAQAGVPESDYRIEDGSGLSRLTLLTPSVLTRVLVFMYGSEHREAWLGLFPVAGEEGTLSGRFAGAPEARRIRAKTGTLTGVSALSGYAETGSGRIVAFSILANNFRAPASEIRLAIDKIAMSLLVEE